MCFDVFTQIAKIKLQNAVLFQRFPVRFNKLNNISSLNIDIGCWLLRRRNNPYLLTDFQLINQQYIPNYHCFTPANKKQILVLQLDIYLMLEITYTYQFYIENSIELCSKIRLKSLDTIYIIPIRIYSRTKLHLIVAMWARHLKLNSLIIITYALIAYASHIRLGTISRAQLCHNKFTKSLDHLKRSFPLI